MTAPVYNARQVIDIGSNQMQLIQLLIITGANHTALADRKRRLIDNRLL